MKRLLFDGVKFLGTNYFTRQRLPFSDCPGTLDPPRHGSVPWPVLVCPTGQHPWVRAKTQTPAVQNHTSLKLYTYICALEPSSSLFTSLLGNVFLIAMAEVRARSRASPDPASQPPSAAFPAIGIVYRTIIYLSQKIPTPGTQDHGAHHGDRAPRGGQQGRARGLPGQGQGRGSGLPGEEPARGGARERPEWVPGQGQGCREELPGEP